MGNRIPVTERTTTTTTSNKTATIAWLMSGNKSLCKQITQSIKNYTKQKAVESQRVGNRIPVTERTTTSNKTATIAWLMSGNKSLCKQITQSIKNYTKQKAVESQRVGNRIPVTERTTTTTTSATIAWLMSGNKSLCKQITQSIKNYTKQKAVESQRVGNRIPVTERTTTTTTSNKTATIAWLMSGNKSLCKEITQSIKNYTKQKAVESQRVGNRIPVTERTTTTTTTSNKTATIAWLMSGNKSLCKQITQSIKNYTKQKAVESQRVGNRIPVTERTTTTTTSNKTATIAWLMSENKSLCKQITQSIKNYTKQKAVESQRVGNRIPVTERTTTTTTSNKTATIAWLMSGNKSLCKQITQSIKNYTKQKAVESQGVGNRIPVTERTTTTTTSNKTATIAWLMSGNKSLCKHQLKTILNRKLLSHNVWILISRS